MLANTEPLAGINGAANSGEQESLLTQHVKEREERKRSALLSRQSAQSRDSRRRGESRSSSRGGALLIAQSKGYLASHVIQPLLVATGESVFFHHGQSCFFFTMVNLVHLCDQSCCFMSSTSSTDIAMFSLFWWLTVGEIIELDPSDGSPLHECPLQQTHCKGEYACSHFSPCSVFSIVAPTWLM
jgi:hypothetical protein